MKKSKSILYSSLISSIVFLLFGLILFFNPEVTISSISYILGGILIIIGFINFLKYVLNKNGKDSERKYPSKNKIMSFLLLNTLLNMFH